MSEPTGPGPAAGMSEDQANELLERLRSAPAAQVIVEVLSGLLNAAGAKLGRRDARLLIDLSGLVAGHARDYLPAEVVKQVDQALSQLRLEQVRAESTPQAAEPEPNDLPAAPAAPPADAATAAPSPPPPPSSQPSPSQPQPPPAASRLWIPGRDF